MYATLANQRQPRPLHHLHVELPSPPLFHVDLCMACPSVLMSPWDPEGSVEPHPGTPSDTQGPHLGHYGHSVNTCCYSF
jgi:hypothetical protein